MIILVCKILLIYLLINMIKVYLIRVYFIYMYYVYIIKKIFFKLKVYNRYLILLYVYRVIWKCIFFLYLQVELINIQKKYYRVILERNFIFLFKGIGFLVNVSNLLNTMMELRKCCNYLYFIKGNCKCFQYVKSELYMLLVL